MTRAMTASEIVNQHADLAAKYASSEHAAEHPNARLTMFAQYAQHFAKLDYAETQLELVGKVAEDFARSVIGLHALHIKTAYLYRVTADMGALLKHAADVLDGTDQWDHHLAPTASGIVRFDAPIEAIDVRGKTLRNSWLVWGPGVDQFGQPATLIAWYNDPIDHPDDYGFDAMASRNGLDLDEVRRLYGRWLFTAIQPMQDGERVGPAELTLDSQQKMRVIMGGDHPADSGTNLIRYVHALWLMLGQTIAATSTERADRPAYRRAVRMNLPGAVTTIHLRRTEGSRRDGESQVEWRHRWIVRGHWRWQPCGPHRSERRRIWIAPFVKGPDDMPLLDRPKLYELDR